MLAERRAEWDSTNARAHDSAIELWNAASVERNIAIGVNGAACSTRAYIEACRELVQAFGKESFPEPSGDEAKMIFRWYEWAISSIRGEPWIMPPVVLGPATPIE